MGTIALLEELGHRVVGTYSGKAALEILQQTNVDLVITDHAMPMMTGMELITAIRQDHPNLPVLLATGYVELPDGADQSLPRLNKPFSSEQLAHAIDAALAVPHADNVTILRSKSR